MSLEQEISLEEKYHSLKKKYNELHTLRIESVIDDSNDLREKIEEHQKVHQIAVNELKQQNEQMRTIISEIESAKDAIESLKNSNRILKDKLGKMDPTVKILLNHTEMKIKCIGKGEFKITIGNNNDFVFELLRESKAQYRTNPINWPKTGRQTPEIICKNVVFEYEDLDDFCTEVCNFMNRLKRSNK